MEKKEKCWSIKNQFPIKVYIEKSWTGTYYVITAPPMTISYDAFQELDLNHKVDISTYNYENGKATWTSYTIEKIKEWEDINKDKITIDYSLITN